MKIEPIIEKLNKTIGKDFSSIIKEEKEYCTWEFIAKEKIPSVNLSDVFGLEIEKMGVRLENFFGFWGNISIESLVKICLIVKFIKPKKIFEIGTYNGMTTLQMAINTNNDCKIYTLDLPECKDTYFELSELDKNVSTFFDGKFKSKTGEYFINSEYNFKINQILCDSSTFDFSNFYKQIDFVFIDAAHDYNNKKKDSENALKMLSNKGVIIWDNYLDPINPFVTKYLSELDLKIYHLRNTQLAVYKNYE